ncbi:MAG TPA: nucleoside-diphosphate sugar epimerase/dehydratase, partial [Anaerolineaceae bacterium]|nr:nucleoside-diphosphate sugar epimerase/dehydratase [Anaerolineaceae bacterium]
MKRNFQPTTTGARSGEARLVDTIMLLSILPFVSLLLLSVEAVEWVSSIRSLLGRRGSEPREPIRPDRRLAAETEPAAPDGRSSRQMSRNLYAALESLLSTERLNAILELRNRHYLVLDLMVLALTPAIALVLREESFKWLPEALPALALYTGLSLAVKVGLFYLLGLYGRYWLYASVADVSRLVMAVGQATIILTLAVFAVHPYLSPAGLSVSRSVPLIDGMITALLVGGMRFSLRGFYNWYQKNKNPRGGLSVLIVGAGEAGIMAVREIWSNPTLMLEPVAFVDDDPAKEGTFVYGLPVMGNSEDIPNVVDLLDIQRILIALPSASLPRQHEIANICRKTGVAVDTLPGVYQILAGHKTISPLPQIDIHRVLKRQPVVADPTRLTPILRGARVMVTGAGGSIGSELCRQIALHQPAELILLGHGENSIFEINLDLNLRYPGLVIHQVIADIRQPERIQWALRAYRPEIVFHMAAHKHVHYMEASVAEAVLNNVAGTRNVLAAASRYGVERFVLMSTDKAINPVSVMGATKRIAELLTLAAAQQTGRKYSVVRCGNVLGSRGSVIPTFQKQIAAGGPLTVTHPDMYRYFMTIPEAVQLVLHATTLSQGGEIFVLDMGTPIRILDMANDLIRLSGFQPGRDIKIVFSGIRQGEKLQEELFLPNEVIYRSEHERIFVSERQTVPNIAALDAAVDRLTTQATNLQAQALIEQMQRMIPEYQPFDAASAPQEP